MTTIATEAPIGAFAARRAPIGASILNQRLQSKLPIPTEASIEASARRVWDITRVLRVMRIPVSKNVIFPLESPELPPPKLLPATLAEILCFRYRDTHNAI